MARCRLSRFCALLLAAALVFGAFPARALAASGAELEAENALLDGQVDTRKSELFACFNGLAAGEEYLVLVSRSGTDPLAAENLLYMTQEEASDLGILEVPFRADETEIHYVVACRRDLPGEVLADHAITVEGGTASAESAAPGATITIKAEDRTDQKKDFSGWIVVSGGVTLEDPSAEETTFVMGNEDVHINANFKEKEPETTPETSKPAEPDSSGTSALLLLGAGAAAAVVVGVVLVMPVELSGRLETADHSPLPDVLVALSQDGALVAQTTTNAEGAFGFKVRRGTYELTFFAPNEDGQPVQTTVKVKAPLSGVTLTAEQHFSGAENEFLNFMS